MIYKRIDCLRPGYITGAEYIASITALLAGTGVTYSIFDPLKIRFIADKDGLLIVQRKVLMQLKGIPYLQIECLENNTLIKKEGVLAECMLTENYIPETSSNYLDRMFFESGFLLGIEPIKKMPVSSGRRRIIRFMDSLCASTNRFKTV